MGDKNIFSPGDLVEIHLSGQGTYVFRRPEGREISSCYVHNFEPGVVLRSLSGAGSYYSPTA